MKILALETATIAGSVAVVDDRAGLIGELKTDVKIAHSERLMPAIQWLLESSNTDISEIDAFAVSIGPGSFTGLRIGLSTAKGFAYALNRPLVPVPTLDAFARTIPFCSYLICPMLDARKNEVYAALYKWEGGECKKLSPEAAVKPAEFLNGMHEPVVITGDGSKTFRKVIDETLGDKAVWAPASKMSPAASTVAEIALEMIKKEVRTDPVGLTPFYIRKSEAEIRWKG